MQHGHTLGQCWSLAVNQRATTRAPSTELVNNETTQEQTGPQSNQCRFNVYCPSVCGQATSLHHWINPQGKEADRMMACSPFSSASLSLSLSGHILHFFLPSSSSFTHHFLHSSLPYSSVLFCHRGPGITPLLSLTPSHLTYFPQAWSQCHLSRSRNPVLLPIAFLSLFFLNEIL